VPPRLSATERIRAQIDELFASQQDLGQILEEVARLSVRLVMQAALEAEVTEFLGRDRYVRGDRERVGYRNGHAELHVKTTAGPVVLERPKLRGTDEPFASRLLGKGVSRTNALEALVISGFVRGLSTRDVEAALAEVLGPEAALSKSTVSRICQAIKDEFDAWKTRDLSGMELEYLLLAPDPWNSMNTSTSRPLWGPPRTTAIWWPIPNWFALGMKMARAGSQLAPPLVVRVKIASLRSERGNPEMECSSRLSLGKRLRSQMA
jgi:putative transposase